MEVRKLYYEDSHLKFFTATVCSCERTAKGFAVTLDATAFYPEGGGQPCDTGTLGTARVLDVQEDGQQVVHLCDSALEVGSTVTGCIDWEQRFDLMQQHSGEHMVSGVIYRLYGYQNMGFHMGSDLVTVDVAGPVPTEDLPRIEALTNAAIWENRPVKCWYPSQEELPNVPYRRKKDLSWPVRIVEFPGTDICACCGTHVKATGEIGLVKILSCVKFRQGVRIEMVSGKRALDYLSKIYEQNKLVSAAFSAKPLETGAAAKRMNEQLAAEKFRATGLQRQILGTIADSYRDAENPVRIEPDLTPALVRELADAIAAKCRGIATVLSGTDESGYSICLVSRDMDVRPAGKAIAAALNGRGGGKPEAFQGSLKATEKEIRDFFANDPV